MWGRARLMVVGVAVFGLVWGTGVARAVTGELGLAGDATPRLDPVPAGAVAVVASSALNCGRVAVIVQNGTDDPVNNVRVAATAARPDGGAVTSVGTAKLVPATLAP